MRTMSAIMVIVLCFMPLLMTEASHDEQGRAHGEDLIGTTFYGTVTDSVTGNPIEKAYVYGFDENYRELVQDTTDVNGWYSLKFNKGGYYSLYAEHDDYYQKETIEVITFNDKKEVNFSLLPKVYDTEIFGTVMDALTGDPIPDAYVGVMEVIYESNGWSATTIEYTTTNEDGKYTFKVYQGNFSIWATKEGYESAETDPFFVRGGDQLEVNLRMREINRGIFGKVMDEDGNPMEGVVVTLEGDFEKYTNVTDEHGNYKIKVGEYDSQFTLSAYEDGYRPYSQDIVIGYNEMKEVNIVMVESILPSPLLQVIYLILTLLGMI